MSNETDEFVKLTHSIIVKQLKCAAADIYSEQKGTYHTAGPDRAQLFEQLMIHNYGVMFSSLIVNKINRENR